VQPAPFKQEKHDMTGKITVQAAPSPSGYSSDRLVLATVPAGMSPAAAERAINKVLFAAPMAQDAMPSAFSRRRRVARLTHDHVTAEDFPDKETAFTRLQHFCSEHIPVDKQDVLNRLLDEVLNDMHEIGAQKGAEEEAAARANEEGAEDEEPDEYADESEEQRAARFHTTLKKLREAGWEEGPISTFKKTWRDRYGSLPKNAIEGGMAGHLASDAKRQREERRRRQAFDERFPDAARFDGAAIESYYGAQPSASFEPISEGTLSRWGEAMDRIKHT
jgi:hypothetical protein